MPVDFLKNAAAWTEGKSYEPQRVNNNMLLIDYDNDVMRMSLNTFPIPKITLGQLEVGLMNEKKKFPGLPTFEDLTIVYIDYADKDVAKWVWEWQQQAYDWKTGQIGTAARCKRNGYVQQFDPEGERVREYRLIGMFPTNVDPGDADLAGEDYHRINLMLSVDKAYPVIDKWAAS